MLLSMARLAPWYVFGGWEIGESHNVQTRIQNNHRDRVVELHYRDRTVASTPRHRDSISHPCKVRKKIRFYLIQARTVFSTNQGCHFQHHLAWFRRIADYTGHKCKNRILCSSPEQPSSSVSEMQLLLRHRPRKLDFHAE